MQTRSDALGLFVETVNRTLGSPFRMLIGKA